MVVCDDRFSRMSRPHFFVSQLPFQLITRVNKPSKLEPCLFSIKVRNYSCVCQFVCGRNVLYLAFCRFPLGAGW